MVRINLRAVRNYIILSAVVGGIVYYKNYSKNKQLDEIAQGIRTTLQQNPSLKTGEKDTVIEQICKELEEKKRDNCKLLFSKYYNEFLSGKDVTIDYASVRKGKK